MKKALYIFILSLFVILPIKSNAEIFDLNNSVVVKKIYESSKVKKVNYLNNVKSVDLSLKIFLGGAYDTNTELMRTDLNDLSLIPNEINYLGKDYLLKDGALKGEDGDKVVDWVFVEIKSAENKNVFSQPLLVQADGDVVGLDGFSRPTINVEDYKDRFYVSVHHRNHLGAITNKPIEINELIDFTKMLLFKEGAVQKINDIQVLWPGDANQDGVVKYQGKNNDKDEIFSAIGGLIPTNTISGYYDEDLNMDGIVKYTGLNNDRDIILQVIGGKDLTNFI